MAITATDADSGLNAKVNYRLDPIDSARSDISFFHIDAERGVILTKARLDRETASQLSFQVVAIDNGVPVRSSSVSVNVAISDLNDNPPKFDQPSYEVTITDLVQRGQFVTKVMASDPDSSDAENLSYSIVSGNSKQAFSLEASSGILSLSNLRTPDLQPSYSLNVSVTDGVFTSFARLTVYVDYSNNYIPTFDRSIYDVDIIENAPPGSEVTRLSATDRDLGKYGEITYSIESEDSEELFSLDPDTGTVNTRGLMVSLKI